MHLREIVLRKIDARLNACDRAKKTLPDRRDLRRESPLYARARSIGSPCALCRDELHDPLGSRKIEPAVQKGALRELPRLRGPRTGLPCPEEHLAQDNAPAVALQLDRILPRIGMRRTHIEEDALVDRAAVRRRDMTVARGIGRHVAERAACRRTEHAPRNGERLCAAHADDADAARAGRRCSLTDGVLGHGAPFPCVPFKKGSASLPFSISLPRAQRSPMLSS